MAPTNVNIIAEYREQKQKLEALAVSARKQMQEQYVSHLTEAAKIQAEFTIAFGEAPTLPICVKAFTRVTGPRVEPVKPEQSEAAAKGKKIGGLRRSLAAAIKNHDGARVDEVSKQLAALGVDTGLLAAPTPEAPPAVPATDDRPQSDDLGV